MMGHDLVIVCADDALAALLAHQLAPGPYQVRRVRTVEEGLPLFAEEAEERGLLCVYDRAPSAQEAQSLVNLARLDGMSVMCVLHGAASPGELATLLAVGIQEVISLEQGSRGLLSLVSSGMHRERERRLLEAERGRAALRRDVAVGLAAAASPREVFELFCDGVLALGAQGVVAYEPRDRGARLVLERGLRVERQAQLELPPGARHPACARASGVTWYGQAREAQAAFPDFEPYLARLSLGVLCWGNADGPVLLVTHAAPPDEAERHALEQLGAQARDALRRVLYRARLEEERDTDRKLLRVVSHDLRNPLNTIRLAAGLVAARAADPAVEALAARIERTARTSQRLVEDLLTFVEASSGPVLLHRAPVDVRSVVAAVVRDASERNETGHTFTFSPTADDATADIDVAHLEQAVGNLLASALAYAARQSQLAVRVSADHHAVYIDVEAPGGRVHGAALVALFAPFERAPKLGERGSLALGQFVVGKVIAAHGGRVWAEPRSEGGVRLCVQVPRSAPEQVALRTSAAEAAAPSPSSLPYDEELSELRARLRSTALCELLDQWWLARGEAELPHPWSLDRRRLLPLAPDLVQANVSLDDQGRPVFVWTSIGPRLERRMRGTLRTALSPSSPESAEMYASYLRCYGTSAPAYDYVRMRGPEPLCFERLLLPLARTRQQGPSEILGMVVFEGVEG